MPHAERLLWHILQQTAKAGHSVASPVQTSYLFFTVFKDAGVFSAGERNTLVRAYVAMRIAEGDHKFCLSLILIPGAAATPLRVR